MDENAEVTQASPHPRVPRPNRPVRTRRQERDDPLYPREPRDGDRPRRAGRLTWDGLFVSRLGKSPVTDVSYRTLAVVGLLLVSGCSVLAPDQSRTETATPAPVPTLTATSTAPEEFAPGLTANGIIDPEELATAHVRSLTADTSSRTSYVLRNGYVERYQNGSVAIRVRARHAVDNPRSSHRVNWTGNASDVLAIGRPEPAQGRAEAYCQIGRCLLALTADNTTTYRRGLILGPSLLTATNRRPLRRMLASITGATVTPVRDNGTTRYRLEATGGRDQAIVPAADGVDAVRNVSFTALVAPSGFIEQYRLSYTGERDGRRVRVTETVRFSALGTATVDRPSWLNEAREAT